MYTFETLTKPKPRSTNTDAQLLTRRITDDGCRHWCGRLHRLADHPTDREQDGRARDRG